MSKYQYEVFDAVCDPKPPTIPGAEFEMTFSPGAYVGLMEQEFTPSKLRASPWLAGPVKLLMFRQSHDGTFLFIYQGVSILSEMAEHFAQQQGGEWDVSNVYVNVTYKQKVKLPAGDYPGQSDIYCINMRRVDGPTALS